MKAVLAGVGIIGAVALVLILYLGVTSYGDILRYLKARQM